MTGLTPQISLKRDFYPILTIGKDDQAVPGEHRTASKAEGNESDRVRDVSGRGL